MAPLIEPRVLKGFRDFLPAAEIERRQLTEIIEASFRSFGFVPIDTPALEYAEILLGKGGGETEKTGVPVPGSWRPGCGVTVRFNGPLCPFYGGTPIGIAPAL